MDTVRLDTLAPELIALIASSTNALTVMSLSKTSKKIRAACYDGLVFRQVLDASQRLIWLDHSLDMDAIARQARNDASIWARFAVADQRAMDPMLATAPARFFPWLPELWTARHPSMLHNHWLTVAAEMGRSLHTEQVYGLVLSILASQRFSQQLYVTASEMYKLHSSVADESLLDGKELVGFWALCLTVLKLLKLQRTHRAVWPYQDSAYVPHITMPQASQIPLQSYPHGLPVPFTNAWPKWHQECTRHLLNSPTFLFDSPWCGYDTPRDTERLNPPMVDIHFVRKGPDEIEATNCKDGIGRFKVWGNLRPSGDTVVFLAAKQYNNRGLIVSWNLHLTVFGLIGAWVRRSDGNLYTEGHIWLWKEAWTKPPTI